MTVEDPSTPAAARPPLLDGWSIAIVGLAAVQPFASFLQANATTLLDPSVVVRYGLAWLAVALVGFTLVRLVTRSRPAVVVAGGFVAFNLSFWNFGRWLSYEPASAAMRWVQLLLWAVVTALAVVLAVKLMALSAARSFLVLFLSIWIVAAAGGFVIDRGQNGGGDTPDTYAGPAFAPFTERPDVYWFVLDEHARGDQLRTWTGRDTTWFDDALAERGFSVSTTTEAAYPHTHLSIPSTLEMTYPFTPGHSYRGEYAAAAPVLAGDNPVVDTFEDNGYRFVYAPEGSVEWSACPEPTGDRRCITPEGGPFARREPSTQLVQSTPIGSFELPLAHNDLASVQRGVDALPDDGTPTFVFAHVLSPHIPHRYHADCTQRDEWISGRHLSGEQRAQAYADDVECVDHELVRTVDSILADDPDAVIIIQSDHGSRLTFDWSLPYSDWSDANLQERFGALNAMRLPGACRDRSIEGESLVNTFRIVLACLGGTEPELLDRTSYFTGFGHVDDLVEVPPERLEPKP